MGCRTKAASRDVWLQKVLDIRWSAIFKGLVGQQQKLLTPETAKLLLHAFVTSKLDYCNSLLYGVPKYQILRLQRIQNVAARLVIATSRYDHISPVLKQLHWLPVAYIINIIIIIITIIIIIRMIIIIVNYDFSCSRQ